MDTNQPSNTLSRRKFVKIGATGAATLFILPALSGCGSENSEAQTDEAEGGAGAQQKTATLAFRGGTIQTMTSENDVAEAWPSTATRSSTSATRRGSKPSWEAARR